MSAADDFRPHPLLRNAHAQSILASSGLRRRLLRRRGAALESAARRHVLDCGDGVRLECWYSPALKPGKGCAVLLHGWEGSHESVYLYSLATDLYRRGLSVARLNLRDHGGTHGLNRELFHSARMDEVFGALRAIDALSNSEGLLLTGFSLGGNFALRVAANGEAADVRHVIAVNPAINPAATTRALDASRWLYRPYFMRKWRRSRDAKAAAFPEHFDFSEFRNMRGFSDITSLFARRFTPYGSLEQYYAAYTVTPETLADSDTPTTIFTAADDPVVPVHDFSGFRELSNVELVITRHGGHCGYVENFRMHSWLERRIGEIAAAYFKS